MSRGRTRARRRRAHIEKVRAEFEQTRSNPEAFEQLLRRLAASDQSVWAIARSVGTEKPLDDAEMAMVAQIVAPHLAGMTPGSIYRRHQLAS
ncbi:MAG TPA: hypothetical protein VH643_34980 [Gemmataceae bacterium]|jgi:hypothetical protein